MTRQEFLEQLRRALQGKIDQGQINDHLQYYENYIMEEARKGRTEAQVIADLGDPRLIARTLAETAERLRTDSQRESYGTDHNTGEASDSFGFSFHTWYGKLIIVLAIVLILVVIVNLVAFLLPFVIPLILIVCLLSWLLGRRR